MLLGTSALLGALHGAPALAADAAAAAPADSAVGEVVVTAERRETSLQQTPIAISAFTPGQIEAMHIANARDISGLVPNLYEPRVWTAPTTQTYSIRGSGQTTTTADPTVALYIDDVYIPRSVGALIDLQDLQRVEILRGPQGTLYGRNSTAGAVRFITYDPGNTLHVTASASAGDWGQAQAKLLLSGPIIEDKVYASVSYGYNTRKGYTWNANTNSDVNNLQNQDVRAKLRFTPTEKLDIQITADGLSDRSNTLAYTPLNPPNGAKPSPYVTYENGGTNDRLQEGGISARIAYKLDDHLTLKSITSYRLFGGLYNNQNDGLPTLINGTNADYNEHELTQELQAIGEYGPVNFSAGLFYFHETFGIKSLADNNVSFGGKPVFSHAVLDTDSIAGYFNLNYNITSQLTATVGARYTQEYKHFINQNYASDLNFDLLKLNYTSITHDSWSSFSPTVGLEYRWTPWLMQYAKYSEGFQAGGYSILAASAAVAQLPYGPETVATYETGLKSTLFGGVLHANAAVFYNKFTNMQLSAYFPQILASTVINAASAHTEGFEFEGTATPIQGLNISATFGYLWSDYDSFPNAFGAGTSGVGKRLYYAPRYSTSGSVSYVLPLKIPGSLEVFGNVQYQSLTYNDTANSPQIASPPQTYVNADLAYTLPDPRWRVDVSVKNLTNGHWIQNGWYIASQNVDSIAVNPPRMVMATVRYAF